MPDLIQTLLSTDETAVGTRWDQLERRMEQRFGKKAGIESALFLIGIQARGRGFEPKMAKEDKQDLIMEGTYLAFETLGLYERVVTFQNGRTVWQKSATLPAGLGLEDQEKLLRIAILKYFEQVWPEPAGARPLRPSP
ncbi:MAG: hypothetical protein SH809_08155 [Rhodothermales bacterium]|nr:hypothetical protein [Rhodothermales bacterium]